MLDVLPKIENLWKNNRNDILSSAGKVADAMKQNADIKFRAEIEPGLPEKAFNEISSTFDNVNGGYGNAPKFPSAHRLIFLLRYSQLSGNSEIRSQIEFTLEKMSAGGIYDQIGGGFHRYSTDEKWLLPHFEKMLYDQALLAIAYTEAHQATGREDFAASARDILNYVIRDMTSPEGAFYSAEDADSEGEEGKFYVWDYKELFAVLPNDDALLAVRYFNVDDEGNFTDPVHGNSGKNILHLNKSKAKIAAEFEISPQDLESRLSKIREKLFQHREKRVKPSKDTKILADWNGLMIAALAKGARIFGDKTYLEAAQHAAHFIMQNMGKPDGSLLHRYRDGESAIAANLDDYAFFTWGLIELYESTFDVKHLQTALDLTAYLTKHFWDATTGGYYFTPEYSTDLIIRQKESYDGAIPSGNAIAMLNLIRLARMTGNHDMEEQALHMSRTFARSVRQSPAGHTQFMSAFGFLEKAIPCPNFSAFTASSSGCIPSRRNGTIGLIVPCWEVEK
ncbi:MAG: thioredoxin domain-containing protein, partial [Lentisphaerota bacterium]